MSSETVLVTGGAGYVGAHVAQRLAAHGYRPVVYDNLSTGCAEAVQWGAFEQGDIRDGAHLDDIFRKYCPSGVLHFAKVTERSGVMAWPQEYYDINIGGAINLVSSAHRAGVRSIVFSSTTETYGETGQDPVIEDRQQQPLSPEGRGMLLIERLNRQLCLAADIDSITMRHCEAAGAEAGGLIGEDRNRGTGIIPTMLRATDGLSPYVTLFGDDYPTRDGTVERDYIHVVDLAEAYVLAFKHLRAGGPSRIYNVGTGRGVTVRELAEEVMATTGRRLSLRTEGRRPSDTACLIADASRLGGELGWSPAHTLRDIVASAWAWQRTRMGCLPYDADANLAAAW